MRRSGLNIVFDHFLWSGCDSFADRADAARSLRTALRESAREHPGVPQVVLAHSHGGTVAVKALDTRDELRGGRESPDVRALLTLGTPFVRLVWQWRRETEGGRQVAMLLPPLLRVLALHARRGGPSRRSGPKTKPPTACGRPMGDRHRLCHRRGGQIVACPCRSLDALGTSRLGRGRHLATWGLASSDEPRIRALRCSATKKTHRLMVCPLTLELGMPRRV